MQLNRIQAVDCVFALFPKGCIRFSNDTCKGVNGFISRLLQFHISFIVPGDFPAYIVIGYAPLYFASFPAVTPRCWQESPPLFWTTLLQAVP